MKKLSILFIAMMATFTAFAQRETTVGAAKSNADLSKYQTFTWAESDPTAVRPMGYQTYYYEFTPERRDPRTMRRCRAGQPPPFDSCQVTMPARDGRTNE